MSERERKLVEALTDLRDAVEVDHKLLGIDPRDVLHAHTFVALAMKRADEALGDRP